VADDVAAGGEGRRGRVGRGHARAGRREARLPGRRDGKAQQPVTPRERPRAPAQPPGRDGRAVARRARDPKRSARGRELGGRSVGGPAGGGGDGGGENDGSSHRIPSGSASPCAAIMSSTSATVCS